MRTITKDKMIKKINQRSRPQKQQQQWQSKIVLPDSRRKRHLSWNKCRFSGATAATYPRSDAVPGNVSCANWSAVAKRSKVCSKIEENLHGNDVSNVVSYGVCKAPSRGQRNAMNLAVSQQVIPVTNASLWLRREVLSFVAFNQLYCWMKNTMVFQVSID